jgi:hypothetical protein
MSSSPSSTATRTEKAGPRSRGRDSFPAQGRAGPDTSLDLEPRDWKERMTRAEKIKDDRVPFAASGMAYYFFLAMVPDRLS